MEEIHIKGYTIRKQKKYTDYYVCSGTSGLLTKNPDKNSGYKPGKVPKNTGSTKADAIKNFYNGVKEEYGKHHDAVNNLTLGIPDAYSDMVNAEPFSIDHWAKSAKFLMAVCPYTEVESAVGRTIEQNAVKAVVKGAGKTGDVIWDMARGGKTINGRWYSEHALERMAPNTVQVRAELESRALEKGLTRGTNAFKKYVDPRGIPSSVVEDAIKNGTKLPGNTAGTWVYQSGDIKVIVNNSGGVVTVIPK